MAAENLPQALSRYQSALEDWKQQVTADTAIADHALTLLKARDTLQQAIQGGGTPGIHTLQRIQKLDQKLRRQATAIAAIIDFPAYRNSLFPHPDDWWWHLDNLQTSHHRDRYDWVFQGSGILLWTISLGLLGDISRRFFLGNPGFGGVSAIAFSGLMTLLNARSELTVAGRKGFDELLKKFCVPSYWHEEARLGANGILSLFLLGFWLSIPAISNWYKYWGDKAIESGRLGSAQQDYRRAIALNPDNLDAHYNLGTLYEDLQLLNEAETHYRIAIQGDVPEAYNNLGRLYLRPPEPDLAAAVALLQEGLELAEKQEKLLKKENSFFGTQYNLFKNLGWARFQQDRFQEAEFPLRAAIGVSQRPESEDEILNPASAYCLLAQVLDEQDNATAIDFWQTCYQLGKSTNPDEDTWMFQACQRLKEENQLCLKP